VVNDAYACEDGSTGIGFKKGPRLITPTEGKLQQGYEEGRVFKVTDKASGRIAGMTYWELSVRGDNSSSIYFGPFAVSPAFQGRRAGRLMLAEVERIARERRLVGIDIKVVNVRTDLISMYEHFGFKRTGTAPFPPEAVHKLTRADVHIVQMRRAVVYDGEEQKEVTITGGCFCGQVRYRVTGEPCHVYYYHCSICRKISGSVVMAWFTVPINALKFTDPLPEESGDEDAACVGSKPKALRAFSTSDKFERWFCRHCASHILFARRRDPEHLEVCHGSLDEAAGMPPRNHIWTRSQLPFLHFNDDLPRFLTEP
jgi:GNAT superfamily N-acetyltransferase